MEPFISDVLPIDHKIKRRKSGSIGHTGTGVWLREIFIVIYLHRMLFVAFFVFEMNAFSSVVIKKL